MGDSLSESQATNTLYHQPRSSYSLSYQRAIVNNRNFNENGGLNPYDQLFLPSESRWPGEELRLSYDIGLDHPQCIVDNVNEYLSRWERLRTSVSGRPRKTYSFKNYSFDVESSPMEIDLLFIVQNGHAGGELPYMNHNLPGVLDVNQDEFKHIVAGMSLAEDGKFKLFVEQGLITNHQTTDLGAIAKDWLKKAKSSLAPLQHAIRHTDSNDKSRALALITQYLNDLGDMSPFEIPKLLESVYINQVAMSETIQTELDRTDKKLQSTRAWRRLNNVISVTVCGTALICSGVAIVVSEPGVIIPLMGMISVSSLGTVWKLIDSKWKMHEKKLKDQRELADAMRIGNIIVIKQLDPIKDLVDEFGTNMEGVSRLVESAANKVNPKELDEMKKAVTLLAKTIDDLSNRLEICVRNTRCAMTVILKRNINHPSEV